MLAVSGLSIYLAELDGDAVGTASAMLFPNITYDCQPTAIIEAVVVAHPYRRRVLRLPAWSPLAGHEVGRL